MLADIVCSGGLAPTAGRIQEVEEQVGPIACKTRSLVFLYRQTLEDTICR